ncbi:MAG: hypothetical protein O3A53_10725 [Acidobacteria bacterium]|nr:hypothetical protein [Acidobacteriota bacterium]MDA1235264.1 hypothetical protein [Acidobacteriota bacterium]
MVIQRIGVLSLGKIVGALYGGLGLIAGAFLTLFSFFGFVFSVADGIGQQDISMLFGMGAILFIPLLYGTLGFIVGILAAAIYNFAAGVVGGLELEVR